MNKALCKIAAAQRLSRIAEPCTVVQLYTTVRTSMMAGRMVEWVGQPPIATVIN
jgi:hypothetical protein